MTDREKQYLIAEIERLKDCASPIVVCDTLLSVIDSMQEEPVSNPIDFEKELYKAFGQVKDFTLGMQIAKRFYDMGRFDAHIQDGDKIAINEDGVRTNISRLHRIAKKYGPINNDLWEAAQTYYEELQKEKFEGSDVIDAFKAGAQWQRQQDEHLIWQISSANYEKGKLEGKKQTISKAYEWLDKNIEKYISADGEWDINWCIMNDFRKSLEE